MALDPLLIAIQGTTQEHLPIEDIIDGIVILKDGSCSAVMRISSVNFDLLSEREQSALVFAYGGILNSLNFPVQIVIHSNTKDVSYYVKNLRQIEEKQKSPLLKERISKYTKFIEDIVKKNDVLSKSFYLVVPFSALELGLGNVSRQMLGSRMPSIGKRRPTGLPAEKDYLVEKAKASLEPKKDHLLRLFSRLGLEIKSLETKELIELFYRIYNEDTAANQKVENNDYEAPVVGVRE